MISWRVFRHKRLALIAAAGLATAVALAFFAFHSASASLPYHDAFATNSANEWQAFGGVWQVSGGTLYNRSDERGAKLVTGSAQWTDYRLQADLEMIGNQGDVGVIVRARQVEEGIDSYNGYYIGLRSLDSALVIGRSDYGWLEGRPVAVPGGVRTSSWYRLIVVVVGCQIAAQATNLQTGQSAWGAFEDHPCVAGGKIGLRSMATGGAWKNIRVTRATRQDLLAISSHAAFVQHPEYPILEADYNRMRASGFSSTYIPVHGYPSAVAHGDTVSAPEPTSIADLKTSKWVTGNLKIRGVVTHADPLFVQDSTGGIRVDLQKPAALNLGDEIEISGSQANREYPVIFAGTAIRPLWDRTLVAPLSISTTQAASGAFDSSLVEVRGYLRSKVKNADGTITLQVSDESQAFTVVLKSALFERAYRKWEPESWIRVAGVCVVGEPFSTGGSAFTILARSPDDIEVLSGPPWWSTQRLLHLLAPLLLLALLGVVLYIRLEKWKMRGILAERERLAHEMHDTLAQSFAGVGFHLQGMRNIVRSGVSMQTADLMQKLDTACDLVAQTHREASASVAALHPDADEGRDLLVALENYAMQMMNFDGLPLTVARNGSPRELSFPVRDVLFHVGREAITNVVRHSGASRIELCLHYQAKCVLLEVRDNGIGFDPDENLGFGIRTMRSRCETIGARLMITSQPGRDTTVSVQSSYSARPAFADWIRFIRRRYERLERSAAEAD